VRIAPWLMLAVLGSAGCQQRDARPSEVVSGPVDSHHDEEEHEALPRQLRITREVAQQSGITTEAAKRGVLAATVLLPGEIAPEPDRTARVSAATAGRLEQVLFNEGSLVKKGEVLALLRVPDVGRLRGALAATAAKAQAARANAGRLRSLKESGLGPEQAVLDSEAEAHAQEAQAQALLEQLGAIGVKGETGGGSLVPLRAPIAGAVVSREAVVGQPIGPEHVIATVVDLSEVWFLGRVFEKDLGRLRVGAKSDVQLNAFPGERFEGAVAYVGQQTDPVARTLTARIALKNEGGRLRLGLFGSAHVEVLKPGNATPQVLVPRSAVAEIGAKTVVFVKASDGDFVVHEVTLGDAALTQVQVLSGLGEGEAVVTHGVFTLKSLLLKSTLTEDE
jgi:membrane fusion protein, heavy metal efflux system